MGTCLGARIASSLSSRVKSERLIGWPSISPRLLRLFGGAFQFRHAGLDVLNLDSLGPMRQDQVGGPQLRLLGCQDRLQPFESCQERAPHWVTVERLEAILAPKQ